MKKKDKKGKKEKKQTKGKNLTNTPRALSASHSRHSSSAGVRVHSLLRPLQHRLSFPQPHASPLRPSISRSSTDQERYTHTRQPKKQTSDTLSERRNGATGGWEERARAPFSARAHSQQGFISPHFVSVIKHLTEGCCPIVTWSLHISEQYSNFLATFSFFRSISPPLALHCDYCFMTKSTSAKRC